MISKTINSIPFYFFRKLENYSDLVHFVSTREGGISEGIHSSFNLSLRVHDDPYNVKRNRELLAKAFNIENQRVIFSSQTHEDNVALIDKTFYNKTEEEQNSFLYGMDAMVTNLKETCLCILTADCASVLLFDPVSKSIGIAHAGWKGTIKKITAKTIDSMSENFGSKPQNIIAAIGPCICGDSFEVGEEVAKVFENTFNGNEKIVLRKPDRIKPHVDIVAANIEILKEAGVRPEKIETSGLCTFQNSDIFFSARKQAAGRFGAGLMMR